VHLEIGTGDRQTLRHAKDRRHADAAGEQKAPLCFVGERAFRRVVAQGVLAGGAARQMHVDVRARREGGQWRAIDADEFERADIDRFDRLARHTYFQCRSHHANASHLLARACQVPLPTEAPQNLLFLWTGGAGNPLEWHGSHESNDLDQSVHLSDL